MVRTHALAVALLVAALAPARGQDHPESQIQDYLALPGRLPASARRATPRSDAEVDALVAATKSQPLQHGPLDVAEVASALGPGFAHMRRSLAANAPRVSVVATADKKTYLEKTVAFEDPFVGTIHGLLLLPKGKGPFPAVLAIHGHGGSAEQYRDEFHGKAYPEHGIALLVLTMRGMGIDASEHEATRALLAWDLTLMGVRLYENLAALAYLRALPEVQGDRIGLVGHSGGSSTGNLLVRVEPSFKCYISDNTVDWASNDTGETYHCENVPGLWPLHALLDDFSTCAMPVKTVPYGFGGEKPLEIDELELPSMISFFDHWLGHRTFEVPGRDGQKYPYTCTFHWFRAGDSVIGLDVIRDAKALGLRVFLAKDLPEKASDAPASAILSLVQIAPKADWEPFLTARPAETKKNWLARGPGFVAGSVTGKGSIKSVRFDLEVVVQNEGTPCFQLGELGKPLTKLNAIDYLSVLTEGWIEIDGKRIEVRALGPASIHYGESLPDYAYVATVPDPKDAKAAQILLSATNATDLGFEKGGNEASVYAYVKTQDGRGRTFFVPLGLIKDGKVPLGIGKTLELADVNVVRHDLLGGDAATGTATATLTERKVFDTTDVVSFFKGIFGHGPVSRVARFNVVADLRGSFVGLLAPSRTPGLVEALQGR